MIKNLTELKNVLKFVFRVLWETYMRPKITMELFFEIILPWLIILMCLFSSGFFVFKSIQVNDTVKRLEKIILEIERNDEKSCEFEH
jgi:hypothetical protein